MLDHIPTPLPMDDDEYTYKRLALKALRLQVQAETKVITGETSGLWALLRRFELDGSDHPAYDATVAEAGFDPLKEASP